MPPSDREASARDTCASISARSYPVLSHERDQQFAYGELPSTQREDIHRDLYLSEKEYRTYGLQGEKRNFILQHNIAPTLGSYQRLYRAAFTPTRHSIWGICAFQRDMIRSDPLYLTETEYRTYDLGATQEVQSTVSAATANTSVAAASTLDSYARDLYYNRHYGASLVDSYLPHRRGEAHLIETDHLRRTDSNQLDRLHSTYASDTLADYSQMHQHQRC